MASNLRVDSIVPATGSSVSIGTATGGVSIPGVLTYEDVTNVDSIGVITARSGINGPSVLSIKTGGTERLNISSTGELISTNGTLRRNVDNSSFTMSGGTASNSGSNIGVYGNSHSSLANVIRFRTGSTERLRIGSSGQIGIAGANYGTSGQVLTSQGNSSAPTWTSSGPTK